MSSKPFVSLRTFVVFFLLAAVGLFSWFSFEFPRASVASLKVGRAQALSIAQQYLNTSLVEKASSYHYAVVFVEDNETWRYLQKALGPEIAHRYLKDHKLSLFYWKVRFFHEGEKGEYRLNISADSGSILRFHRIIDDAATRAQMRPEQAKRVAEDFLKAKFNINWSIYVLKDELQITHDHRVDHTFSWRLKDADVSWSERYEDGVGKLLITATVSGGEVLSFSGEDFEVPDNFTRFIDADMEAGRNFSLFFWLIYVVMMLVAVFVFVRSRHFLVIEETKKVWVGVGILLWILLVANVFNNINEVLWGYPTTQPFASFQWRLFLQVMLSSGLVVCGIIITAFAGEALCALTAVKHRALGLVRAARSSFLSRDVASALLLGYCGAAIMLGLQAVLLKWGRTSFGVWSEDVWFTQFSGATWPMLAAITLALRAAVSEEVLFRLLTLHWVRSFSRWLPLAVILSSFFWASGHAGYEVFPSWFRVLEVGVLGLFMALFYLRFGLIAVISAHYVFDVFWGTAGCLFTASDPFYFTSALLALVIPLVWACAAFFMARSTEERITGIKLSPRQDFNVMILSCYAAYAKQTGMDRDVFKQQCLSYGWDPAVVGRVFDGNKIPDQA